MEPNFFCKVQVHPLDLDAQDSKKFGLVTGSAQDKPKSSACLAGSEPLRRQGSKRAEKFIKYKFLCLF